MRSLVRAQREHIGPVSVEYRAVQAETCENAELGLEQAQHPA
jgi:hypothetical protein